MSSTPFDLDTGLLSRLDFTALLHDTGRMLQVRTALPDLAVIPERLAPTRWSSVKTAAPGLPPLTDNPLDFQQPDVQSHGHADIEAMLKKHPYGLDNADQAGEPA